MADGGCWIDEEHSWAHILHHVSYLLPLDRRVAVDVAFAATRLGLALRTAVEARHGII